MQDFVHNLFYFPGVKRVLTPWGLGTIFSIIQRGWAPLNTPVCIHPFHFPFLYPPPRSSPANRALEGQLGANICLKLKRRIRSSVQLESISLQSTGAEFSTVTCSQAHASVLASCPDLIYSRKHRRENLLQVEGVQLNR